MGTARTRGGVMLARGASSTVLTFGSTNTPPTPPTNLVVTATTPNSIGLGWDPGTDPGGAVDHYAIYRVDPGPVEVLIGTSTTTSYTATGLDELSAFVFRVKTVDDGTPALESEPAVTGGSTTSSDVVAPTTPGNFVASAITSRSCRLDWNPSTDPSPSSGIINYEVYRLVFGDPSEVPFATVAFGTNFVVLTGLDPSTPYAFRIRAVDRAGNKSAPAARPVTTLSPTDTTPPTVPANLRAPSKSQTDIDLAWDASTDPPPNASGVDYYELFETIGGVDGSPIFSPTGTTKTVGGYSAGTTHVFKVRSVDVAGNRSAKSAPLSVTTTAAVDTSPPTDVGTITPSAIGQGGFTLGWPAASDPESGIDHYLVVEVVAGHEVQKGTPTARTITIGGYSANTQHVMRVYAVNGAGIPSDNPSEITVTTLPASSGGRPDHVFGLVRGNVATDAQINEISSIVALENGGTGRLRAYRAGADWRTFYGVSPTYATVPAGILADFNNIVANNCKGHAVLAYAPAQFQKVRSLGQGTAVAGNNYIDLAQPVDPGPTGGYGKWGNLVVWSPDGLLPGREDGNALQIVDGAASVNFSADRKRVLLKAPISAGMGGTGEIKVGGSSKGDCWQMTPYSNPANTTSLEPIGLFSRGVVSGLGNRLRSIEVGNEVPWSKGGMPYADPEAVYLNHIHAYCGAKLANPNIIVYAGSTGGTLDQPSWPVSGRWYQKLKDYGVAAGRAKFRALYANLFGGDLPPHPDPWDVLCVHIYGPNPTLTGTTRLWDNAAQSYNVFDGEYPIAVTEFGPSWGATGNGPNEDGDAQYGHDWVETGFGFQTGEVRWPHITHFHSSKGDAYGEDLSSTNPALRKAAALNIWEISYLFVVTSPEAEAATKALYANTNLASRRFNINDGTPDVVDFLKAFPTP